MNFFLCIIRCADRFAYDLGSVRRLSPIYTRFINISINLNMQVITRGKEVILLYRIQRVQVTAVHKSIVNFG